MRRPGGYAVIFDGDGIKSEADTFTCGHCGSVVHVKAKASPDEFGSMCRNCMKMVCRVCADRGCVPFEKKLEMMERRYQALRSYGLENG